jgi:hypothetical protein
MADIIIPAPVGFPAKNLESMRARLMSLFSRTVLHDQELSMAVLT